MQDRGAFVASQPAPAPAGVGWPRVIAKVPGPGWAFSYVAIAIVCQLCLLVSVLAPGRVIFRSAAFGTSFLWLLLVPGRSRVQHAARSVAIAIVVVITLAMLNPEGSTAISIAVHWCFYLAVLAPVFWIARLELNEQMFVRLLLVIWLFNTASSAFGVLQVLFPGQFQPVLSTLMRPDQVMGFRLVTGEWVPRPMGLSDVPGGAAAAGLYATLLGLGVTLARPFRYARVAGAIGMLLGTICIYLCQVRAVVVMMVICLIVLLGTFAVSGRLSRLTGAFTIGATITIVGFMAAFALGGRAVTDRLETLIASDPGTVYVQNRGHFVVDAFTETLPRYPLGAGLGRWGMVNVYFGAPEDALWSEVQWVGWTLDGGFLMLLAYPTAVLAMLVTLYRVALHARGGDFGIWAAIVLAYGVGTLAISFGYPIFMSTGGVEFWLITAATVQAASQRVSGAGARPS